MARKNEIVAAVDFGSRNLRVLIAEKDADGAIRVVGHGTSPGRGCVSQGVIQDLSAAQVALNKAVAAAEKEARVTVRSLFCGVNGRKVETFIREGIVKLEQNMVEQSHMDEALDLASRDILAPGKRVCSSLAAQEWFVDDLRVQDPIGLRGHILKARVHYARLPSVIEDNITSCVQSQGRELEDIIFLPIAAAMGCLTPEDMELGAAVLDMGRSTTGLAVYRDHCIQGTHCFEWGGYHITRDLAAGLQISFDEADELILEYGLSASLIAACAAQEDDAPPPENQALRAREEANGRIKLKTVVAGAKSVVEREEMDAIAFERARELLTKVRQHMHARGLSSHLVRGIVLTGGTAEIGQFVDLAEAIFRVPCRVGVPNNVEIIPTGANQSQFTAAIGILRHGFTYREALHSGRIEGHGPAKGPLRKLTHVLRKYFF